MLETVNLEQIRVVLETDYESEELKWKDMLYIDYRATECVIAYINNELINEGICEYTYKFNIEKYQNLYYILIRNTDIEILHVDISYNNITCKYIGDELETYTNCYIIKLDPFISIGNTDMRKLKIKITDTDSTKTGVCNIYGVTDIHN